MPIERDNGTLYVHSTPLGREVFERYFYILSKTFSAIFSPGGLGGMSGPRVAALMLKKLAQDIGAWEGPEGAEIGLMGEIRRLTTVLAPTKAGWEMIPLAEAIDKGIFDREDGDEAENAIVFFMLGSAMFHKRDREAVLSGGLSAWNAELSSQSIMELQNSLSTSTETDSSGARATA